MQYTEQDVCLSTGNRQILGKQEGRADKSGEKGQLGWKRRSEEESGLEDTPFVLGRQNTGNTALHEQLHSTCRQSLSLTPAWYPNNSIEHLAREVSLKSVHGRHFSLVFGPNQAS